MNPFFEYCTQRRDFLMKTKEILNAQILGEQFRATGSIEVFDDVEYDSSTHQTTIIKKNAGIKIDVMIWNPQIKNVLRKIITVKIKSADYAKSIVQLSDKLSGMPLISFKDLRIGDYKGDLWASASSFDLIPRKGE